MAHNVSLGSLIEGGPGASGPPTPILPPGRFSAQPSLEDEAKADLQQLLALQSQRGTAPPSGDISNQPEFINTPGATTYREALNATLTKYGSAENFARLIGAGTEKAPSGGSEVALDLPAARERFPAEPASSPPAGPTASGRSVTLPLVEGGGVSASGPNASVTLPISPAAPPLPPATTVGPAPQVGTLPPSQAAPGPLPPAPSTSGTLTAPGGPPPLGGLISSKAPPGLEIGPKPETPEAQSALSSQWEAFFNKPETRAALLQFGVSMLQGTRPGETNFGSFGRAAGEAGEAANRATALGEAEDERARVADIQERGISLKERELVQGTALKEQEIAAKLLLGTREKGAFFRAMQRLKELKAQGFTPENNEEAKLVRERINSLTKKSGFFLNFNKETGEFTFAQGDTGSIASGLSAQRLIDQAEIIQSRQATIDMLDSTIGLIETDPTLFGTAGQLRGVFQSGAGAIKDLGALLEKASGGTLDINAGVDRVLQEINALGGGEEFEGLFNPDLSQISLLENTLAFDLARLRLTTGGKIRALRQVFADAKGDVNLQGIGTAEIVKSRLEGIRTQFVRAKREASGRLSTTAQEGALRKPVAQMSPQELSAEVDRILGGGGR